MMPLTQFDEFLKPDGPAALVLREWLMPVEGEEGVLFPATFAGGDGFPGGYNIDTDAATGKSVALIDSVGSQANRIEPIFKEEKYAKLVPQITVTAGDNEVSIFEVGHRAGDALLRCSSIGDELQAALKDVLKGDSTNLAKIAPTSLVFGVWDSRPGCSQAKLPRVLASTIRAYDVRQLTRHAQYAPPVDYSSLDVFSEEDKAKAEGDAKSPLAQRGFVHIPVTKRESTHGGIIADGGVRRDATLAIAAIRLLHAGKDAERTLALRRYILGLALVAFTYNSSGYLRQGCLLVINPDKQGECVKVLRTGKREPITFDHDDAVKFAAEAANAFGVGESKVATFEKERAKADVKGDSEKPRKGGKGAGKKVEKPDAV